MIFKKQLLQFSSDCRINYFYLVFSKGNKYVFIWKIGHIKSHPIKLRNSPCEYKNYEIS